MTNIVANIISWFNNILLAVVGKIVLVLGKFTGYTTPPVEEGTPGQTIDSLFYAILNSLTTNINSSGAKTTIFSIATIIFIAVIGINIFQEAIRYFTEADVGLDRNGVVKVIRESLGVVAFLVLYYKIINSPNLGFGLISTIAQAAGSITKTAVNGFIGSVANTTVSMSLTGGPEIEFIVMLMAFGLIMGMINCIAQLVGTFIVGIVGIVIGTLILPIHISLMMLGRGNNAGRALLTIINAIVLIGVLLGLGDAIVSKQVAGSFTTTSAQWSENIIKYLIYFGLLEGYKSLVQRANGVMTDMLANLFQLG